MNRFFGPLAVCVLTAEILTGAEPSGPISPRAAPIGREGLVGHYQHVQPGPQPASVVVEFKLGFGALEADGAPVKQWLEFQAAKANGTTFRAWLLCKAYPPESLGQAQEVVVRYIFQEGAIEPLEFRDRITGRAVLPVLGAWSYLLPHPIDGVEWDRGFARRVKLLGQSFRLDKIEASGAVPAPTLARVLRLRSDVLIGVPHNTKQVDDRRRYDKSDYRLIRLTQSDYEAMIDAGMNCFNVDAEQRRWIDRRPVYYWGGGLSDLAYPECLYRSGYLGPVLFLDEPAVVTRDYVIRPRLKQDSRFAHELTPRIVLDAFHEQFHKAKYEGGPTELIHGLSSRADVDLGEMRFLQENLFTWETMISTGIHQLSEGTGPPPFAMVLEPPGHLGTRRTLPEMNMTYGCQIPVHDPANLTGILYGFLRGAARLSGREWGTSIYGAVDQADSPWFLSHAYDLGARLFFFWDTSQLACVPFGECLDLSRHLQAHVESRPHRDLQRLKSAAETVILLPPGYNLGHVHMGKGSLWGLGELNLERTNLFGVTYRAVMHNFFTEIERCTRLGIAYDLVWDVPGLSLADYREVVRIREDGKVEVQSRADHTLYDGPRTPSRPDGVPPQLTVMVSPETSSGSARVTARAAVIEGSAPVFYTARANPEGIYENAVVFWELFGPRDEDYRVLLGEGLRPQVNHRGAVHDVTIDFGVQRPGLHRLRAATVDAAGRSAVVWKTIVVRE